MSGGNDRCHEVSVGKLVTIHKVRQSPGIFGGDAIYITAPHWTGGLILDSNLVAVVPKGTVIHCPENPSGDWTLYNSSYESLDVDLRIGPFKAVVRHTLEPTETKGPAVRVVSGHAAGHEGYLTFRELEKCTIDGTSYEPNFDWYDYENHHGVYEDPPDTNGESG